VYVGVSLIRLMWSFLDLVFTNAPVDDVSVACADTSLLELDRHHRAYDIELRVCCYEFEAMESRTQRYMFRMADCAAIVNELDEVDWFSLFSGKTMDCCVDLFYELVCFERHVPMRFSRGGRKLPWITGDELQREGNRKTMSRGRKAKGLMIVNANSFKWNFFHSEKSIS
jgi:hypothetical protein